MSKLASHLDLVVALVAQSLSERSVSLEMAKSRPWAVMALMVVEEEVLVVASRSTSSEATTRL